MAFIKGLKLVNDVITEMSPAVDEINILTLNTQNLQINSSAVLATPAEINRALQGASTSVTSANLNLLTSGGNASALHNHDGEAVNIVTMRNGSMTVPIIEKSLVYVSGNDRILMANASAIATCRGTLGIALTGIGADDVGQVVLSGVVTGVGTGFTAGVPLYLSLTDGQLTTTPPTGAGRVVLRVGMTKNATDMFLKIDMPVVLS